MDDNVEQYRIAVDLPWFFESIPTTLEKLLDYYNREWLYEFMGNTYLHFKNDNFCGQSYSNVLYQSLIELTLDSLESPEGPIYEAVLGAVEEFKSYVQTYEYAILNHFDALQFSDTVLDYAQVTCAGRFRMAYWLFFKPPF